MTHALDTTLTVHTAAEWRAWLDHHGRSASEIWLVLPHRNSGAPGLGYAEAVEHALCFGWIDGLHRKHDATSSRLRFSPRNPRSTWSRLNRRRAEAMIARGLMTERGQVLIDHARRTGTWQILPDSTGTPDEELPPDLRTLLDADDDARRHFASFPPSSRLRILAWIVTAKRPETRQRRIERTVTLAAQGVRANH
ncbi:YdeI/OmpD-associated family protein [Cryptosporangium minutisporangium]|uniref:YdeI/OmpD-associated family protein n=1 Tax=Cryptosporangium minutisporangium TaxID=113569 RepID=A0ABP6SQ73_9ACTN